MKQLPTIAETNFVNEYQLGKFICHVTSNRVKIKREIYENLECSDSLIYVIYNCKHPTMVKIDKDNLNDFKHILLFSKLRRKSYSVEFVNDDIVPVGAHSLFFATSLINRIRFKNGDIFDLRKSNLSAIDNDIRGSVHSLTKPGSMKQIFAVTLIVTFDGKNIFRRGGSVSIDKYGKEKAKELAEDKLLQFNEEYQQWLKDQDTATTN